MSEKTIKCAVLLSGSGRTLSNFLEKIDAGELPLQIVAVVSSRSKVRGVEIAEARNIPVGIFPRKRYQSVEHHNEVINNWLSPFGAQMVVLAGYLCFYMQPDDFKGPVVNIHPALLPKYGGQGFYGDKVHEAVLKAGDTQSGCTVHLVDEQYDTGSILDQKTVPVLPQDDVQSLASRVFAAECELFPRVLAKLAIKILQG